MIGQPIRRGSPSFKKGALYGKCVWNDPRLGTGRWSNDACRGYVIMAMEDCGFQRRIYGVLWGSFMKYLTSTAWRMPKKSTIPVLTELGPYRPEVEKAQRAAPAGCRLLTFPHRTSGKGRHIHALSQRRFSMTQAVTYERETKSVAISREDHCAGKPHAGTSPEGESTAQKEIERCLYEVFRKYGDRFP